MTSATVTLPPVTPEFQAAVRQLGYELGWKRVARMIAFGPTREERSPAVVLVREPRAKRQNGTWTGKREKLPPGFKRNALGGLVAPKPGGYEREWGDLVGVGIWKGVDKHGRCPSITIEAAAKAV